MIKITLPIIFFILVFISHNLVSQEIKEFSLDQAQDYALKNNYDIRMARNEVEIARKQIKESLAIGLPQVDAGISNTNYFNIPTTLIPDFITPAIYHVNENNFGLTPEIPQGETQFFPAQFGTEYNASIDLTAVQLLFSGKYIIGVKTAQTFLEKTRLEYMKNENNIKDAVSRAYYFVLVTEENYKILKENLASLSKLALQTRETFNLGFIEETEADQLDLLVADIKASLISLENQVDIAYAYLKQTLGLNLQDSIRLTDNFSKLLKDIDFPGLIASPFNYNNHIDYRILKKQKEIAVSKVRLEQSSYLPTLTAFLSAQTMAMRNEYNFFDTDQPWYPSTFWGIEMSIPIWSSGNRSAKVQKAQLNLNSMHILDDQLRNGLDIYVNSAKSDLSSAYMVYQNKKNKLELADKINQITEEKYKEGISSSFDLLQSQNQYLTANTEYISAILDLLDKKISLEYYLASHN